MTRRVAITGLNGFVGTSVARALTNSGHEVVAFTRRPVEGYEWRRYELGAEFDRDLFTGIDGVIHCAWDLSLTSRADIDAVNVGGTVRLIDAAAAVDVRCQFISSMSAYAGSEQIYGRAKLSCEEAVVRRGGNAIRLGLAYGGEEGSMIGTLRRLACLRVIPILGAGSHQFLIHIDDAVAGLQRLVETPAVREQTASLAHPDGVRFRDLIRALGIDEVGRAPVLLPVPWRPVYAVMRLAEAAGVSLPLRADSVLGLVRPAPTVLNVALWRDLGITIRPLGAPLLGGAPALGDPATAQGPPPGALA